MPAIMVFLALVPMALTLIMILAPLPRFPSWASIYPLLFASVCMLSRIPIAQATTGSGCEYPPDWSAWFWFERIAFAPLGMLQSAYEVHGFDSLGRPIHCGDLVALVYGFVIYWLVFRCLAKLSQNLSLIREPFPTSQRLHILANEAR